MNFQDQNPAFGQPRTVIDLSLQARATFITRVYTHLFGALTAFALIEVALFTSGLAEPIAAALLPHWMFVLIGFMLVGTVFNNLAHRSISKPTQYLALGAYVLIEALIFVPLLHLADTQAGGGVIASAGFVSLAGFAGLSAIGIFSRKDFSFLGGLLKWGFIVALVLIAGSFMFGFNLGLIFSVGMVGLAGGAILYSTQKIIQEYPEDMYVGASLQLFAAVALLFWYVLSIFMSRD